LPVDKQRVLVLVSKENVDQVLDKTKTYSFDMDKYCGEQQFFYSLGFLVPDSIMLWVKNIPPKVKYGYQLIYFDPDVIYLIYDTREERGQLIKIFGDI